MKRLKLKTNSKPVRTYYREIQNLAQLNLFQEGAVSPPFAGLLRYCARQFEWTLAEQHSMKRGKRTIRPDGVLLGRFSMVRGVWEAKDSADNLAVEVKKKFSLRDYRALYFKEELAGVQCASLALGGRRSALNSS